MPYDGSNVWTLPANTAAVSGAAIQSTKFNSITADIESALNDLRYQNLNIVSAMQTFLASADLATARTNLGFPGWVAASASGPASLQFPEDTDNGSNSITVKAPASLSASVDVTLPSIAGELPVKSISDTMTTGSLELGHASDTTLSRDQAGVLAIEGKRALTQNFATAQASTSGSAIDFTGIPSWVREIDVIFYNVSQSVSNDFGVRIGDSGGIESSGYDSASALTRVGTTPVGSSSGDAFVIYSQNSGHYLSGIMFLRNIDGNKWTSCHTIRTDTSIAYGAGYKELSGTLDRVQVFVPSGAFDSGIINICYR